MDIGHQGNVLEDKGQGCHILCHFGFILTQFMVCPGENRLGGREV
jgi:hypothetical protein